MGKRIWLKFVLFAAPILLISCQKQAAKETENSVSQYATFKVSLIDAPTDLKEVHVNIKHFEVLLAGHGKQGRVIFGEGTGDIDLLTLQNGVQLPLTQMLVPDGLQIQQIRMILEEEGHYAVKMDNSICDMKTPSAQKTGVKIILTNQWSFEKGHDYNLVVDFDAKKSVVVQGHGGCLLKPVLKLASATKKVMEEPNPEPTPDVNPEDPMPSPDPEVVDLIDGSVNENDSSGDGFEDISNEDTSLIDPDDLENFFEVNF